MLYILNMNNGFYHHLEEAIAVNISRAPVYAQMTHGKSLPISLSLIACECISSLAAFFLDAWAWKYQKRGIPVVSNDFVSMHQLLPLETPPRYQNYANKEVVQEVSDLVSHCRNEVWRLSGNRQFGESTKVSYETLKKIRCIEEEHQCHFAMSIHLIESIGLASLNAMEYVRESNGETSFLSSVLIRTQTISLLLAVDFDRNVQKIHQLGVGIVLNDVPHIPFKTKYHTIFS